MKSARKRLVQSFDAQVKADAKVLVLGSMPGVASLEAARYYAHPRNGFWPIMMHLLTACHLEAELPDYNERLAVLAQYKVGLWDVMQRCERTGSLDADIREDSIEVNDFVSLFQRCPNIQAVYLNGGKAAQSWRKYVGPQLSAENRKPRLIALPSTSPAHAAMSLSQKCAAWQCILEDL